MPLDGWETRIPSGFAKSMRTLAVQTLIVERTSLRASAPEIDVHWAQSTVELFSALVVSFPTP